MKRNRTTLGVGTVAVALSLLSACSADDDAVAEEVAEGSVVAPKAINEFTLDAAGAALQCDNGYSQHASFDHILGDAEERAREKPQTPESIAERWRNDDPPPSYSEVEPADAVINIRYDNADKARAEHARIDIANKQGKIKTIYLVHQDQGQWRVDEKLDCVKNARPPGPDNNYLHPNRPKETSTATPS